MSEERAATGAVEQQIRGVPGVLGAVVFNDATGNPVEIQVFTRPGADESAVRRAISEIVAKNRGEQPPDRRGEPQPGHSAERIFVFELTGDSPPEPTPTITADPDRPEWLWSPPPEAQAELVKRPARGRPQIGRVSLASIGPKAQASVSLVFDGREAEGLGTARKTPHGLRVTAAATLEAAQALAGRPGLLALEGVSLVEALNRQIVLVLVHSAIGEGRLALGAAIVGDSPVHEATVRATLDAINRQLERVLAA